MTRTSASLLAGATLCALGLTTPAEAVENGLLSYPPGSSGVYENLFPPIPGLFLESQTSFTSANALYGDGGKKSSTPYSASIPSETLKFLGSYDFQLLGAHVYSLAIVPTAMVNQSFYGNAQNVTGFGNITITPLILLWDIDKHSSFSLGEDFSTPLKTDGVGNNYWTFMITPGYRWEDKNGFVFSVLSRLLFNTRNGDTNYYSGTSVVNDFNIGWNLGKWQLGAVGSWAFQLQDDSENGVAIGNRFQKVLLGPSVAYDFGHVLVNFNYQFNVYAENTSNASTAWFNIAFPILPLPPHHEQVAAKY